MVDGVGNITRRRMVGISTSGIFTKSLWSPLWLGFFFFFFFFTLVTGPRRSLSLNLSDTKVYEPQIRARLGNHNTTVGVEGVTASPSSSDGMSAHSASSRSSFFERWLNQSRDWNLLWCFVLNPHRRSRDPKPLG